MMKLTDMETAANRILPVTGLLRAQCREAGREGAKDWTAMLDRINITDAEIVAAMPTKPGTADARRAMIRAVRREIGANLRRAWDSRAFGD